METTVKLSNGHYENGLTWKNQPPHLENNRPQAEIRLQMLKKRLQKDTTLHEKYTDFMADLLQKRYARKATTEEQLQREKWYPPHHPVFHPQN